MTIGAAQQFFLGASKATGGGAAGYQIERSLRFNSSDSAYASRGVSTTSTRKIFTFSVWCKRSKFSTNIYQALYCGGVASGDFFGFNSTTDVIRIFANGASDGDVSTTAVFRDPSAWYHIVIAVDTTQATPANRIKVYVNNIEQSLTGTYPTQDYVFGKLFNTSYTQYINTVDGPGYGDFYLADYHCVDGQALTPSSFTEVSATTGQLIPKAYTGSFGTNGFHLDFADNSAATATTLGKDTSGNSNNWTPNNFSVVGGPSTVTTPASNAPPTVDYLVVAGGGGGGGLQAAAGGGGGGAGGFLAGNGFAVTPGTQYTVTVGSGGASGATGSNGQDSVFSTLTAVKGGRGGTYILDPTPGSGGSGGGAPGDVVVRSGAAGTSGQGFAGGSNTGAPGYGGGGGGGAGSVGSTATAPSGGNGGSGSVSSITGSSVTYAAGGRGGDGSGGSIAGGAGGNNTGNGGGGGGGAGAIVGGAGGSGIVVIRYANTYDDLIVGGGLTYTYANTGGYKIYSFTASATAAQAAGNDSLVDTPTSYGTDTGAGGEVRGNYATLNPLEMGTNVTLSNGNLDAIGTSSWRWAKGTIAVTSGKWYWEVTHTNGGADNLFVGITKTQFRNFTYDLSAANAESYNVYGYTSYNGAREGQGVSASYGAAFQTAGDIIGVALDMDAGTITFYKNGVSQGVAFSSITSEVCPAWGGTGGNISAANLNFGQRPFAYQTPGTNRPAATFKALCDTNLGAPLVALPNTVMDVALWTGNGSTQTISGLGFSPDFVWVKVRSNAGAHGLFDTVRGAGYKLVSNVTNAEVYNGIGSNGDLIAFNSDGFNLGDNTAGSAASTNLLNYTYVGWAWDAGGTTDPSNQAGSITSQVRANVSAGFSVSTWTGTATAGTVGHGLGVAPEFIIVKNRTVADAWYCYHKSLGNAARIQLNETSASTTGSSQWNSTSPTSTVYSVGSGSWHASGNLIVSYNFAPVVGYSSFGSYVGNGSATDGPFVYTGMRPRWILVKRTDSADDWPLMDTARTPNNPQNLQLWPNFSNAESTITNRAWDALSNGFKLRGDNFATNANGGTYIYAAFAESPFQYARAR